jgi:FMN phosphatase YigB (HAD superfamily)
MTLEHLDAAPKSAAMIGNSLKSDIAPALELNLRAIWVNRGRKARDNIIVPDAEISNLTQVESALGY